MNLLNIFKKLKKTSESCYLGRMWACAVKCRPWSDPGKRYGVMVKNVGVVEAFVRNGETHVLSDEWNPFPADGDLHLEGPVGHLEYVQSLHIWIGFFETKDEAKEKYRQFVAALVAEIEAVSPEA